MKTLSRTDLIALARRLVVDHGGAPTVARTLGVSRQVVARALAVDVDSPRYDGTLVRIIEALSGRTVEQRWRVTRDVPTPPVEG